MNEFQDAEQFECPICFEEVSVQEIVFLKCHHLFCVNCINSVKNNKCPLCRLPFVKKDMKTVMPPRKKPKRSKKYNELLRELKQRFVSSVVFKPKFVTSGYAGKRDGPVRDKIMKRLNLYQNAMMNEVSNGTHFKHFEIVFVKPCIDETYN